MPAVRRSRTIGGTNGTARVPVRRNRSGKEPTGYHGARFRRPERDNASGDDAIHAHNTLSAENTHVQVIYPFHPLHGARLQIVRRPKRGDGAVSVIDPAGRRLKIPVWMLSPDWVKIKIIEQPHLSKEAL